MDCRSALYYGVLFPAFTLERIGFGVPIQNPILREIIPRVVALVAPFFYAYQAVLGTLGSLLSLCCGEGIRTYTRRSYQNCVSSLLEIPEKFIFGHANGIANYCGDQGLRYNFPREIAQIGSHPTALINPGADSI